MRIILCLPVFCSLLALHCNEPASKPTVALKIVCGYQAQSNVIAGLEEKTFALFKAFADERADFIAFDRLITANGAAPAIDSAVKYILEIRVDSALLFEQEEFTRIAAEAQERIKTLTVVQNVLNVAPGIRNNDFDEAIVRQRVCRESKKPLLYLTVEVHNLRAADTDRLFSGVCSICPFTVLSTKEQEQKLFNGIEDVLRNEVSYFKMR
jgi:hypothetical protein